MEKKMRTKVKAHTNIALIKYWGKRDERLNLPAVGSISLTLDALWTETEIEFNVRFKTDRLILNGQPATEKELRRTSKFLDLLRQRAGLSSPALISSKNNFPTAAGLASSASGFAALTVAAARALKLELSGRELSIFARQGSGSAARSIFGGFVEMHAGRLADGSDAFAEPIVPPDYWDVRLLIGVTSQVAKKVSSTAGMNLSKETSPYYQAWINAQPVDLKTMRRAIEQRDFEQIGQLAEHSCLKMHALALSSNPGILYWNGVTVEAMHSVRDLRASGTQAYFTIDAGPQIKALCLPEDEPKVRAMLESIPGIQQVISCAPGPAPQILEVE